MLFKRKRKSGDRATKPSEPRHLRRFLQGSFHHYSTIFFGRFSLFFDRLFQFLFGKATISAADREEIRQAARLGTVVFVLRSPSRLEYLRMAYILRRDGLPYPQFAHYISLYLWQPWLTALRRVVGTVVSILERQGYPNPYRNGYVETLVTGHIPTLLPLHQFRGVPRRFAPGKERLDPLLEISRISREKGVPIVVVPLVLIYGRAPDRDIKSVVDMIVGPSDNPGSLRRIWLGLRHRRATFIKVARPQTLEDLEEDVAMKVPSLFVGQPEADRAYHIRQYLLDRIETERRVVLGPARKSRDEMIEAVLHEPDFVAKLMRYCKENDEPFIETRRRARRYLEEMAADLRPGVVRSVVFILDRILGRVYPRVEVDMRGLEKVRRITREMPVVFVPSHKSHIDYIILNYIFYKNHMSLPLTVTGVNLNFWPISSLFRGAGALYMRRSFRGKRIYTLCFVKYLAAVLREDLSLTFFVEGGRSRIGKLLPPKTGFIQYLLEAAAEVVDKPLAVVPVSIGYERIFEERFYTDEAAGRPQEGENLQTMLRHRRLLTKSRGRVWIDFAEPITMWDWAGKTRGDAPLGESEEIRRTAKSVAHRVVHDINRLQPVTEYAIVAEALLAGARRGIPADAVKRRYDLISEHLREEGAPLPTKHVGVETILTAMVAEKVLGVEEDEESEEPPFYLLEEDRRLALSIYANTVVPHHHWISLVAATLLSENDPLPTGRLFERFCFLVSLLRREFVFGATPERTKAENDADFDRTLGVFEARGWVGKHSGGYLLTGEGRFAAETFAAVVSGYVESYDLAARSLLKRKSEVDTDKDLIKFVLKKGHRLLSMGELQHPEAVHKIIVETALRHYSDLGLLRSEYQVGEKTKAGTRTYQVADFVRLREMEDTMRMFMGRRS
ncbi:MAG: 1-acyl-sn-glycerol-3-phosphate acyltransferase [Candidatus Lernaella stagnicola]|nr:1-acyl-sn-glycerol-3-phosphate acyltransferase [Candidatus Lernaella stagnicola]